MQTKTNSTVRTVIGLTCALAACGEQAPRRFGMHLHAERATDMPLAGVHVWADGRDLGITNAAGRIVAELHGIEGTTVSLTIACPAGHRTDTPTRRVPLRSIEGANRALHPIEVDVRCEPELHRVALVVRAEAPNLPSLPIEVDNQKVGQTDASGVAHVLFEARPGSTLRVKLATSSRPNLEPRDPVQTFQVGDEDAILLFAQAFSSPAPKRSPNRRVPVITAPPDNRRPYRIH